MSSISWLTLFFFFNPSSLTRINDIMETMRTDADTPRRSSSCNPHETRFVCGTKSEHLNQKSKPINVIIRNVQRNIQSLMRSCVIRSTVKCKLFDQIGCQRGSAEDEMCEFKFSSAGIVDLHEKRRANTQKHKETSHWANRVYFWIPSNLMVNASFKGWLHRRGKECNFKKANYIKIIHVFTQCARKYIKNTF